MVDGERRQARDRRGHRLRRPDAGQRRGRRGGAVELGRAVLEGVGGRRAVGIDGSAQCRGLLRHARRPARPDRRPGVGGSSGRRRQRGRERACNHRNAHASERPEMHRRLLVVPPVQLHQHGTGDKGAAPARRGVVASVGRPLGRSPVAGVTMGRRGRLSSERATLESLAGHLLAGMTIEAGLVLRELLALRSSTDRATHAPASGIRHCIPSTRRHTARGGVSRRPGQRRRRFLDSSTTTP